MSLVLVLIGVVFFAAWITAHTLLCYHIAHTSGRRAFLALVLLPLAPIWGAAYPKLRVAWLVAFGLYLGCLTSSWLLQT